MESLLKFMEEREDQRSTFAPLTAEKNLLAKSEVRPQCKSLFRQIRKYYRDEVSEAGSVSSYVEEKMGTTDSEDLSLNLKALTES